MIYTLKPRHVNVRNYVMQKDENRGKTFEEILNGIPDKDKYLDEQGKEMKEEQKIADEELAKRVLAEHPTPELGEV